MDTAQIVVTAVGLLLIAGVAWFFFGEREKTTAQVVEGKQVLHVTVKGGYSPDTLVVKRDRPVRIEFNRQDDFGISRPLPAFKTTAVEFTPEKAGQFSFTCGMNMLRGKLIVEQS
jgi:plastocyanin domain-containing protein